MSGRLIIGDCVEKMALLPENSVDAVVTDPPYGLEFMGKEWDKLTRNLMRPDSEADEERLGEYGSSYAGRRSKLPDLSKTGKYGREMQEWHEAWAREALRIAKPGAHLLAFGGTRTVHRIAAAIEDAGWEIRDMLVWGYASGFPKSHNVEKALRKSGSEDASNWSGWGTALKPSWEPIILARKPLDGTVASNVLKYGTGAMNVGATRIGDEVVTINTYDTSKALGMTNLAGHSNAGEEYEGRESVGRWPANIVLTDDTLGDYSKFFMIPKANRKDREPPEGTLPLKDLRTMGNGIGEFTEHQPGAIMRQNNHPTVKPTALMQHLIRLVTPPGGVVIDPFLGSGTTAKAAIREGFSWIGIEKEREYAEIATARIRAELELVNGKD